MSMLKKLFPNYKTKAELRREIAYYKGVNASPISLIRVDKDIYKVRAAIDFTDDPSPIESLKKRLSHQLVENLDPYVEYDMLDAGEYSRRVLVGTLYVAKK